MNEAMHALREITRRARCRADNATDDAARACELYARALWKEGLYYDSLRQFRVAAQLCPTTHELILKKYEEKFNELTLDKLKISSEEQGE